MVIGKMMKLAPVLVCVVVLLVGTAGAGTVTEDFSYSDGNLYNQGTAGNGWAGAWGSVAYRETLLVTGGVAWGAKGSADGRKNQRSFAEAMSITAGAPTIWLSFDMLVDFVEENVGNSSDLVDLLGGGSFGRVNVNTAPGNKMWSAYIGSYAFSTTAVPDNVWSTVCVKLAPTGDGTATFTMWIDPDFDLAEDDPGQVTPLLTDTLTGSTSVTGVIIGGSYYTSGIKDKFDNLRVSNESSPFVPEPATVGLLALGGMGIFVRRRRS